MKEIKKRIAKVMIAVMISTLLSPFYTPVSFAEEITGAEPEIVAGEDDNYGEDSSFEDTAPEDTETEDDSEEGCDTFDDAEAGADSSNEEDSSDVDGEETDEETGEKESGEDDGKEETDVNADDGESEKENDDDADENTSDDSGKDSDGEADSEDSKEDESTGDADKEDKNNLSEDSFSKKSPSGLAKNESKSITGWGYEDGWKVYYVNGEKLTDCIVLIDNDYYGFSQEGYMFDDTGFWYYPESGESGEYYRAKEGGKLYVNEWYDRYDWHENYFGPNGAAYRDGIYNIDGNNYYFDGEGDFRINTVVRINGKNYSVDHDGIAYEIKGEGWVDFQGERYYIENGFLINDCVKWIDGLLYGFESCGHLEVDIMFGIHCYDEEGNYVYKRYCALEDGRLLVNEWWDDPYSGIHLCYFGEDGVEYEDGIFTIDGQQYYFGSGGSLVRNSSFEINGKKYVTDENGIVFEIEGEGWINNGGNTYYLENGKFLQNCTRKIDNAWYGFDQEGCLYKDINFSIWYYDETGEGINKRYRAKEDGKLYENEWYESYGVKIEYYGNKGVGYADTIKTIGDYRYIFDSYGYKYFSCCISFKGKNYVTDSQGRVTEVNSDGWVTDIEGNRYYCADGAFLKETVRKIDNNYYGFYYSGRLCIDSFLDIYDEKGDWDMFAADKDGILVKNTWVVLSYGTTYYFGKDRKGYRDGAYEIEGKVYYFSYSGVLMKNTEFEYNGQKYISDKNGVGHLLEEGKWNEVDGELYYIVNGEMIRMCVYTIDGTDYLFGNDGKLLRNRLIRIDGVFYAGDESGVATVLSEGWNAVGAKTYFLQNGWPLSGGFAEIEGKMYAFGGDAGLIKGRPFNSPYSASGNAYLPPEPLDSAVYSMDYNTALNNNYTPYPKESNAYLSYCADEKGAVLHDTWYHDVEGFWCYYDETGRKRAGWLTLDDGTYYLDMLGVRQKGFVVVEGKRYYFDSKGLRQSGWVTVGKYKYYLAADGEVKTGWQTISGKKYYMNSSGKAQTGFVTIGNKTYYFNENGVMKTGWQVIDGKKYYFNENGVMKAGWFSIDGKKYYSNEKGVIQTGFVTVDKKKYYLDSKGVLQSGWVTVGKKKYYLASNGVVKTGFVTISNKKYYFNENGVMKTGFVTVNNKKYYFGENGVMKTGFVTVSNKKYYFSENGVMKTGWVTVNNKKYYFGENGVMKTGWVKISSYWYYFNTNGTMVTGNKTINGKVYKFKSNGVCTNK